MTKLVLNELQSESLLLVRFLTTNVLKFIITT